MFKLKDYIMPNIGVFFRHKNTIDVFVEDNYDEEFYKALLNRIFDRTGHKINKLLPLGCKTNVIEACRTDQASRPQKRVYIVDGDLELINDENNHKLNFLHVHDRYCIENYLLEENPLLEILHDALCVDKVKIQKQLGFENWLDGISEPLIELFLHYNICKRKSPTIQTVGYSVGRLCVAKKKVHVLDIPKINQRIEEIKLEILKSISKDEYDKEIKSLRAKWPVNSKNLLKIVSGKDYLIPLLLMRFAKFRDLGGISIPKHSLRLRLAKLCETKDLEAIALAIN